MAGSFAAPPHPSSGRRGQISADSLRIVPISFTTVNGSALRNFLTRGPEGGTIMRGHRHLRSEGPPRTARDRSRGGVLLVPGAASPSCRMRTDGESEDFDSRTATVAPSAAQLDAVGALGAQASWTRFGTPQSLYSHGRHSRDGHRRPRTPSRPCAAWLARQRRALPRRRGPSSSTACRALGAGPGRPPAPAGGRRARVAGRAADRGRDRERPRPAGRSSTSRRRSSRART